MSAGNWAKTSKFVTRVLFSSSCKVGFKAVNWTPVLVRVLKRTFASQRVLIECHLRPLKLEIIVNFHNEDCGKG